MAIKNESAKLEMFKMYTTKYDQGSYEEEYRVQFLEDEYFSKKGYEFIKLGKDIKLVGLVLGPLNKLKQSIIKENIPLGLEIEITTTRIAFQSFDVVLQKRNPPFKLIG